MTTIQIGNLRKEFPVAGGVEVAVDDIQLQVDDGEFVTLVGPSGCGKTTTLRCVAGLETPTDGRILFDGEDVTNLPPNKRGVAMMFQNIALYPHMTVSENIAYPLKVRGVDPDTRRAEARDAAELMQISELLDKYPGDLSGGQRQRAALARTVVYDADVLLMDEPLSDLDAKLKVEIRKEIQRIQKRLGVTTLYVTHDQEEATTMSDKIAVMNDGQLAQYGTADDLYERPVNRFVAEFIGNPKMNFLKARVDSNDDDRVRVEVEGRTLDLAVQPPEQRLTGVVWVGYRPESIAVGSDVTDPDFTGQVQLVERISDRLLATIEGPQGELRVVMPSGNEVSEGETTPIALSRSRVHLFDDESRELVAVGRDIA
jgi:multiple sugar transport system ATP-binding protein